MIICYVSQCLFQLWSVVSLVNLQNDVWTGMQKNFTVCKTNISNLKLYNVCLKQQTYILTELTLFHKMFDLTFSGLTLC